MATENLVRAFELNLVMYQNDKADFKLTITKDDDTPYNLSGKTLRMQLKRKNAKDSSVIELTTAESGGLTIGGVSSNEVTFNKEMIAPSEVYIYDLECVTDKYTICFGTAELISDVSR